MNTLVGSQLDRYKLETLIGEGGMGSVYKASHISLQNDVAIKVMHPHFARQSIFQQRFLQEAQTAAKLNHRGIVRVHDFGEAQSYFYIAMEYIPGGNLQEHMQGLYGRGQWIPLNEAVLLVSRIALALDHTHQQGVLHRDIKPANIMIKLDPEVKEGYHPVVTDLGLAKLTEGGLDTMPNVTMGTPAYMSPEQATGDEVDARSDVYSLGILLFELTVGRRPFPIKSLTEALRYHTREMPPRPLSINPNLSEELEAIILRAMEKEPTRRFQSARELAETLDALGPATLGSSSPPAAPQGALSLYTHVQESLSGGIAEHRAGGASESSEQPVAEPAPDILSSLLPGQAHIQILQPTGQTRTVSIDKSTLIVGRGEEADVTLDDGKISRTHIRIQAVDEGYSLKDLESTNGSFLGQNRLQPGVSVQWSPLQPLRIGNHRLRLMTIPTDQIHAESPRVSIPKAQPAAQQPTAQQPTAQQPTAQQPAIPLKDMPINAGPVQDGNAAFAPGQPQPKPRLVPRPEPREPGVSPHPQKKAANAQPQIENSSDINYRQLFLLLSPLLLLLLAGIGWYTYPWSNPSLDPLSSSSESAGAFSVSSQSENTAAQATPTIESDAKKVDEPVAKKAENEDATPTSTSASPSRKSITVEYAKSGKATLSNRSTTNASRLLHRTALSSLSISEEAIAFLHEQDIQHLQFHNYEGGMRFYVNGNQLPGFVWDNNSRGNLVQLINILGGNAEPATSFASLLSEPTVDFVLTFPSSGQKFPLESSESKVLDSAEATAILDTVRNTSTEVLEITYAKDGTLETGQIPLVLQLSPVPWENFHVAPDTIANLTSAGLESLNITLLLDGIAIKGNNIEMPYFYWESRDELDNSLGFLSLLLGPDSEIEEIRAMVPLLLSMVAGTDIRIEFPKGLDNG